MKHKAILCFYTDHTSTSFIYHDIIQFSKRYERVEVFTFLNDCMDTLPDNVNIHLVNYQSYHPKSILLKHFILNLAVLSKEFIRFPKYILYFSKFRMVVNEWLRALYLADVLKQYPFINQAIHFSFWYNNWALALSVLKKQNDIKQYASRAHGSDLYEYRVPQIQRIAFRWLQLKYVAKVFTVSESGSQYLKQKYPSLSHKVSYNYLGTKDPKVINPFSSETFVIASCALINNIKRVEWIPKVLAQLNFPLTWYHIGEENIGDPILPEFHEQVMRLEKKQNVKFKLLGKMDNESVFRFYESTPIHLFMSLSSTEGLPISICEAASFGIPILATDVGGCKEIANENTGALIPKELDINAIATTITEFMDSHKNSETFRYKVKEFWQSQFDCEKNFDELVKQITIYE
jgi:glycosyltransferase involved in cell wall biosynthesis